MALLVVVSVMVEFVISFWIEPPYMAFLTYSAVTDAGIAFGVVGEVLFGMWDSRIQTELRKRSNDKLGIAEKAAAEANVRVEEARQRTAEIERVHGWRHVSEAQAKQISTAIRDIITDTDLLIEYENSDREAWSYSLEIAKIFGDAGLRKIRRLANSHLGSIAFGVRMVSSLEMDGTLIAGEFAKAKIPVQFFPGYDLSTHLPRNEVAPNLYIFVGPKPPPTLEGWEDAVTEITIAQSANARDADLEKRTAWRRVSSEQNDQIARALHDGIPLTAEQIQRGKRQREDDEIVLTRVLVECQDDPECKVFGNEIAKAFAAANMPVRSGTTPFVVDRGTVFGFFIVGSENVSIVRNAFINAGLLVSRDDEIETRLLESKQPKDEFRVYVGHKPLA